MHKVINNDFEILNVNNYIDSNFEKTIPLVSIIMPCHNSAQTIKASIESVIKQTFKEWELLIVNDFSSDESKNIIENYSNKDKRIILINTDYQSGAAIARNLAIKKSSGRFISFLDSDDLWENQKLEKQIYFMLKNNIDFTYSDYYVLYPNNKIKIFKVKDKVNYKSLLKNNVVGCLTAVYDTKRIGKIYMPENAIKREDFAAWLLILKKINYAYKTNGVLATYRLSATSVSSNKRKMIKYHWNLYRNVEKISLFNSLFLMIIYIFNKLLCKY